VWVWVSIRYPPTRGRGRGTNYYIEEAWSSSIYYVHTARADLFFVVRGACLAFSLVCQVQLGAPAGRRIHCGYLLRAGRLLL
jgi:hypothetical protein